MGINMTVTLKDEIGNITDPCRNSSHSADGEEAQFDSRTSKRCRPRRLTHAATTKTETNNALGKQSRKRNENIEIDACSYDKNYIHTVRRTRPDLRRTVGTPCASSMLTEPTRVNVSELRLRKNPAMVSL